MRQYTGSPGSGAPFIFAGVVAISVRPFGRLVRRWGRLLAQAICQFVLQATLAFGPFDGFTALAIGDVGGTAATSIIAMRSAPPFAAMLRGHNVPSVMEIRSAIKRWSQLMHFGLPSAVLIMGVVNLTFIALPMVANPIVAGRFALAPRLLGVPGHFVSSTATPILQHRFSNAPTSDWRSLLIVGTGGVSIMAATGMLLMTSLLILLEPLFTGGQWVGIGNVLLWVFPFSLGLAAADPLANFAAFIRVKKFTLLVNALFLTMMLALVAGGQSAEMLMLSLGICALIRAIVMVLVLAKFAEN